VAPRRSAAGDPLGNPAALWRILQRSPNDELMLGPNLLAAPVVVEGARQRQVYLPRGPAGWYDFYDETWHAAGQVVSLAAPLERLPLLVPAGGVLPLTAHAQNFSRLHDEPSRCVRVLPGREAGASSFTLYEDDGISLCYLDGERARLDLQLDWDDEAVKLRVAKRGGYALPYHAIAIAIPANERRRLVLESGPGAPHLVALAVACALGLRTSDMKRANLRPLTKRPFG
jgi:alpha-glucosidase